MPRRLAYFWHGETRLNEVALIVLTNPNLQNPIRYRKYGIPIHSENPRNVGPINDAGTLALYLQKMLHRHVNQSVPDYTAAG